MATAGGDGFAAGCAARVGRRSGGTELPRSGRSCFVKKCIATVLLLAAPTSWWSFNERTTSAGNLPLYKAYGWTAFLAAIAGATLIAALTLLFGARFTRP